MGTLLFIAIVFILLVFGRQIWDAYNNGVHTAPEGVEIRNCTYIGGHPDIDRSAKCTLQISKRCIDIVLYSKKIGSIEAENISEISIDDASSIEHRVTVPRVLLTGIVAFAIKKKEKHESAFFTIYWNDGRFNHATVFGYQASGAMNLVNESRNAILRALR